MSDEVDLDGILRSLHLIQVLQSVDSQRLASHIRECVQQLKHETEQLDALITPTMSVRDVLKIPNFDRDREVMSDIISSAMSDIMIEAVRASDLNPEELPMELLIVSAMILDPIQADTLNILIPLH